MENLNNTEPNLEKNELDNFLKVKKHYDGMVCDMSTALTTYEKRVNEALIYIESNNLQEDEKVKEIYNLLSSAKWFGDINMYYVIN
jgi:hypothetical protein